MSFLNYTTTFVANEDGSSIFTINMDDVTTKCMKSLTPDPEFWICNAVSNRARIEGEHIYKSEMERHLEAGTMPTNPTKESLILAYEIPVSASTTSDIDSTKYI
jgi:hypothetical protein